MRGGLQDCDTKPIGISINTNMHPSLPYNRNITVYCGICIINAVQRSPQQGTRCEAVEGTEG